jgi:hypothetical protein
MNKLAPYGGAASGNRSSNGRGRLRGNNSPDARNATSEMRPKAVIEHALEKPVCACARQLRPNWHHFSLNPNWCGGCGPFSIRLSIRFMPLTGRLRQKRKWRSEFCGLHQMESPTQ